MHVGPHTHGEGCTGRARGRSEQRASGVSKNIGVFCGYMPVLGLSRGGECASPSQCGSRDRAVQRPPSRATASATCGYLFEFPADESTSRL